ncbi:G0/G1 switch protein 2 [Dunckerocampus dactyliophorus]|uniref:G0/G1 switch protein 2 n=1 Tax=Dunckerocampus dactyliophorus TaxID=161453 RepID=UPI0024056791|nr:G0/G1 switch protein 2 [Dunckerocampus dactyliophorus]
MSLSAQQTMQSDQAANTCTAGEELLEEQSLQEVLLYAKEMLSQRPRRGLLKVYLVGSVFAVLGTVVGLAELVCHPFSSGEPMDAEMVQMVDKERRTQKSHRNAEIQATPQDTTQSVTFSKSQGQRNLSNRLHAS